jgi:aspartyl-tRNA(Asn)/glutamyl-tRNA(Gln) amidotransferase subunit C
LNWSQIKTEKKVDPSEIQKVAHLARLDISDDVAEETAQRITDVLKLVDQLQAADTDNVSPMAHPLDAVQRLRADTVTEQDQRADLLANAPASEDGLFLVPKVID